MPLATVVVDITSPLWTSSLVLQPDQTVIIVATGLAHVGPGSGNTDCNPGGATPNKAAIVGSGGPYGSYRAVGGSEIVDAGAYCLAVLLRDTEDDPGKEISDAVCPGNDTPYVLTNDYPTSRRLWMVFNGLGNYYSDYSGGPFTAVVYPPEVDAPMLSGSFTLDTATCTAAAVLTWPAVDGAVSYTVYRDGEEIASGITETSYEDSSVSLDTTYVYTVRTVGYIEISGDSDPVTITPSAELAAPTVTVCQSCGRTRINISWSAVTSPHAEVTGYAVYRGEDVIALVNVGLLAYVDDAVEVGTTYTYSVAARLGTCWSGEEGSDSIRVRGWQGEDIPTEEWSGNAVPAVNWRRGGCSCGS